MSPFSEDVDYQLRRRHRQPCSQPPTRDDAGSGTIVSVRVIARRIVLVALASALVLVAGRGSADAQPSPARRAIEPRADRRELEQSTQELIAAARAYQASLEALLPFQEAAVAHATEALAKRRELLTRGIVARREVDEAERAREAAEAKLEATRAEFTQSETLVAEAVAAEALRRVPATPTPSPQDASVGDARFTYYNGSGSWSLPVQASKIERFFSLRFGRALPVSAYGQTAAHNRLGFDHRDALDVALHPDSIEGRALMAYLRSAAISFIAFRSAVPGAATGAHIHIGPTSHRLTDAAPRAIGHRPSGQ